jgi:nanoRNase/pAp phosphatase (c-di-AMP/oligoRNAs hydrolase)
MEKKSKTKREIRTISEKNRIASNITNEICEKDSFLLIGHKNPDEDCIASLVAFALLLSKFQKKVSISTCGNVQKQLGYLLNICNYNSIRLIQGCGELPSKISAVVILDTPKPSMIDANDEIEKLLKNPGIRKIEIDHHLAADSAYAGDPDYCLVTDASSTCELIGFLALKISKNQQLLDRFGIREIFSRNMALAILTGIIGDSKMGKFLKTNREKWFYRTFSAMFDTMLFQKTVKGSHNFSSMDEIFKAIQDLSEEEKECYDKVMTQTKIGDSLGYAVIKARESSALNKRYGNDIIVAVTKAAADKLSEKTGKLGLVVYYDPKEISNFIQFRLRRSHDFMGLDLRTVLEHFKISNGGGHPGAIGFRIEREKIKDLQKYVKNLVTGIEKMAAHHS